MPDGKVLVLVEHQGYGVVFSVKMTTKRNCSSFLLTKLLLKRLIKMCMLLMVKIFFAISIKILAIYPLVIMKKQIHECLSMFGMIMESVVKCNFR